MSRFLSRIAVAAALVVPAVFSYPVFSRAAAPAGQYTVMTGGVVHDNKSGLSWQQATSATTSTYANALTYCSAAGWRLPTIKELQTLVDDRATYVPTIDTTAMGFPDTKSTAYWSSTTYQGNTSYGWLVSFNGGSTGVAMLTATAYVRCVR